MNKWIFVLFLILPYFGASADELDELDALLDKEEIASAASMDDSLGDKSSLDEFKLYRKNQGVQFNFKGVKKSLIEWDRLKTDNWLSLDHWKKSRIRKDQEPEWKLNLTERNLRELAGRFLECVGDCRVHRGEGFSTSQYNSSVRELDEIITLPNSYAWIAMMDGTLVRVSPNTSLSFKEINIGEKENFIHLRINSGNILILNREAFTYKERNLRETDKLFLPMSNNQANPEEQKITLNEKDLSNFIAEDTKVLEHYKKLNEKILSNNEIVKSKPTYTFVVMPNGTLYGKNLQAEFVVLLGGESYVKRRSYEEQKFSSKEEAEESPVDFFYRGFENKNKFTLEPGVWYQVAAKGREILPHEDPLKFQIGEYLTSNIPSILMARELLLEKHSEFLFSENPSRKDLAEKAGYRLWGKIDEPGEDLNLRLKFLLEYTRRIETTNLVVAQQFRRKASDRGELTTSMVYDQSFYRKALEDYIVSRQSEIIVDTDREVLNSTRKPFWKIINGKK
jgi:hypothetical protein